MNVECKTSGCRFHMPDPACRDGICGTCSLLAVIIIDAECANYDPRRDRQ